MMEDKENVARMEADKNADKFASVMHRIYKEGFEAGFLRGVEWLLSLALPHKNIKYKQIKKEGL